MALELLAGPFTIKALDGVPVDGATLSSVTQRGYDEDVGFMCNSSAKTYTVSMDGIGVVLSDTDKVSYCIDLSDYPLRVSRKYQVVDTLFEDKVYKYNKYAGVRQGLPVYSGGTLDTYNIRIKLPDRYLGVINGGVYFKPLSLTPPSVNGTLEATVVKGTWAGAATLSQIPTVSVTRDLAVLAFAYIDGQIVYYNHVTKAQVGRVDMIGANKGAWYNERHNIWVKWGTDDKISVYAVTPVPYSITTPAGAAPLKGKTQVYSVTVKGQHEELVTDELIDWTLSGGSVGSLERAQSKTSSLGVASIRYIAPTNTVGSATLIAELRF